MSKDLDGSGKVESAVNSESESAGQQLQKLIQAALTPQKETFFLKTASTPDEYLEMQSADEETALKLSGKPEMVTYVDGLARFRFSGTASTIKLSAPVHKQCFFDAFSQDLEKVDIRDYTETRTVHLPGDIVYQKHYRKRGAITEKFLEKITEEENILLPYTGNELSLSIYLSTGYQTMNVTSVMYARNEDGILEKTYGTTENEDFRSVESAQEWEEVFSKEDYLEGRVPQEFYYRNIPVTGIELEMVNALCGTGSEIAGPRDASLDAEVSPVVYFQHT